MANLQSLFPKAVNVLGEVKHAERNLWRNVLIVALEDAIGKGWRDYGIGRGYKCERARAYFLEPNRDFAMVCQYAGFDHEYVRKKAKKYFEENKI
tara:strand:- start:4 stop:288 length:285 start_codon:yes stop_codon:yes gene_type:complete